MKRIILFTTVLILLAGNSFGDPYIIKLKVKKEIVIEGRTYYISRVTDDRDEKGKKIGDFWQ